MTWLTTELLFVRGSHLSLLRREFESINLCITGYATGYSIILLISSVKDTDTQTHGSSTQTFTTSLSLLNNDCDC